MSVGAGAAFVYLASASPRRRELLAQLGLNCEVVPADIDETHRAGESAPAYVRRLALEKAHTAMARLNGPAAPVLAADTAVVLGDRILGKPADEKDARQMLADLSGRSHEVYSAVAVLNGEREDAAVSCSRVHFRVISETEMAAYWRTGEPQDKAGAYAIQGIGAIFVDGLEGSYSGVMGLPLFETAQLLESCGWRFWKD
jgi:septum formation protein